MTTYEFAMSDCESFFCAEPLPYALATRRVEHVDRQRALLILMLAELEAQLADDVNAFELAPDDGQEAGWQVTIDSQRADDHLRPVAAPTTA